MKAGAIGALILLAAPAPQPKAPAPPCEAIGIYQPAPPSAKPKNDWDRRIISGRIA